MRQKKYAVLSGAYLQRSWDEDMSTFHVWIVARDDVMINIVY